MSDLSRIIARHAAFQGERDALIGDDISLTYGQLEDLIGKTAGLLAGDMGVETGDVIAWLGANSPWQIVLTLAAARIGAAICPLNWRLSPAEQGEILANCQPKALFIGAEFAQNRPETAPECVHVGVKTALEGGEIGALVDNSRSLRHGSGSLSHPLLIVYTSGTTGEPKGAVLSQGAVLYNALNAQHMHELTARDRVLTVLPMFHVGGLNIQTVPALMAGACVIVHDRFEPERTLRAISAERASLTLQVPTTLAALIAEPGWAKADLSSLRAIATGSTDVPVSLIEQVHERDCPVIQIYGATETGPVAIYQRIEQAMTTVGSIGCAGLHTDIRIIAADGRDAGDNVAGEIAVSGPHVAQGYWRNPQATRDSFRDGWFLTGDVAMRDETGLYWFKDRVKNVIISGGENIYPAELERILARTQGVREAAVVGVADKRWGQSPVAVIVRDDAGLDAAAVMAAFDGRLARYKQPRRVVFTDRLPRNAMGKVMAEDVRAIAEQK